MNSNNYKDKKLNICMNKRAQATIFIIVALAIVIVILALIYFVKPTLISPTSETLNPQKYLKDCIEPSVKENIISLSEKGGYSNPEGFLEYDGNNIKYLCYTAENYKPCIVQQPLLKEQFEKELNSLTENKAKECFASLKDEYEKRGYIFSSESANVKFRIVPDKINLDISTNTKITKGDYSRIFNGFNIEMESKIYDLIAISISIIDFESTYGDSETTTYMQYYPDLKIEKIRLSEGSKIYRVSDVVTKEEFSFAVRSLVFPPGYGLT